MSGGGNFQGMQGGDNLPPGVNQTGTMTGGPYTGGTSSWGGNNPQQIASRTFSYPGMGFQNPNGWSPSYGYPNGGFGYNNRPPQQWQPPVQNPGMPPTNNTAKTAAAPAPWEANWGTNKEQAQRFANAGKFGRAKQQIEAGGGYWAGGDDGLNMSRLIRKEAAASDNYGGDWDWGNANADQVAQAQRFANAGLMGYAKGAMGEGNWNKGITTQFAAERDAAPAYEKGDTMGFDWGATTKGRLKAAKGLATAGTMGKAKAMYEKGGGVWDKNVHRQMKAWAKGNK
jgi:hypothetical protein